MISTLFEIVRVDSSNFQAYYCLECMVNSFPFIFNFKQVIDSVLPAFDNYMLNLEDQTNDEEYEKMKKKKIKAAITSLSFLIFVLNSPKNMDEFVHYFFDNYINSEAFFYFDKIDNIFTEMSENHITHHSGFLPSINDHVLYE